MTAATFGPALDEPARCDGCGTETSGATIHSSDDGVTTYCPGCEGLRQVRGVTPGDHEQYRLREGSA